MTAKVEYLKRLPLYEREKPFRVYYEIPKSSPDQRRTNLEFEEKEVPIQDLRKCGSLDSYSLDKHGFAIRNFEPSLPAQSYTDRSTVEEQFLPEVEKVIRSEIPDITAIYFFDWRVCQDCLLSVALLTGFKLRSAGPYAGPEMIDLNDPTCYVRPAQQVHVG
jgi:hypothetical protein